MADPDAYIEISDFSPGIHGSLFASADARKSASPTLKGAIPGNGIARVDGTHGCYADQTGALVPFPRPQLLNDLEKGGFVFFGADPSYATIADAAAFDITGDISLWVYANVDLDAVQSLLGKWVETGDQRSYRLDYNGATNRLVFEWSTDGTAAGVESVTSANVPSGSFSWFGVTMDVDDGSGNHVVKFWNVIGNRDTKREWSEVSSHTIAGTTSIHAGTADVNFGVPDVTGTVPLEGSIAWAAIGNGLGPDSQPGGDTVFLFDGFPDLKDNDGQPASITSTSGHTMTMTWGAGGFSSQTLFKVLPPVLAGIWDDDRTPDRLRGVFLLDAALLSHRVGQASFLTGDDEPYDFFGGTLYALWGYWYDSDAGGDYKAYIHGREYRFWVDATDQVTNIFDFLFNRSSVFPTTGFNEDSLLLPSASLVPGRFYYGFTTDGLAIAAGDETFRADWWFPCISFVVGPPMYWRRGLSHWHHSAIVANDFDLLQDVYVDAGAGATGKLYTNYTPSIGVTHGNVIMGMSINLNDTTHPLQPLPSGAHSPWYVRRGDKDYALDAGDFDPDNRNKGPWCPTLAITHQGRMVIADRRITVQSHGLTDDAGNKRNIYSADDVIFFGDQYLPMQNYQDPPDATVGGIANAAYDFWAAATHENYLVLPVAEDSVAPIGTVGVVGVDQMLAVKHWGGGALITGDMNSPTIRRLPFLEPTRGINHFGIASPLGFVYGSTDGVFAWQGGDTSQKLSSQIEGFFWNHVNEVESEPAKFAGATYQTLDQTPEIYAGSRGRFGFWNGFVCVPNNYLLDTRTGSWWRFPDEVPKPGVGGFNAEYFPYEPYNVYLSTGETNPASPGEFPGRLLAFPHRNFHPTDLGSPRPFVHVFDIDQLVSRYSWQSHPIIETQGRTLSFQEIRMVVTPKISAGDQRIRVVLEGITERGAATTSTTTLTIPAPATENPQLIRADITPNFQGEYVTVRIEADSNPDISTDDFAIPAPKIHSFALGYKDRARSTRNP